MAIIDVRCTNTDCAHEYETNRPVADWPATPPCERCQSPTEQFHPPPRSRWSLDPVIVYRASDGEFRFPGDPAGTQSRRYDQLGYERIELRSAADVRRFEKTMNEREFSRASRRVERMDQLHQQREAVSRSDMRHGMAQGFMIPEVVREGNKVVRTGRIVRVPATNRLRDIARAAMVRNDGKPRPRATDVGFHLDAFSNYRSNRDESRDDRGRRRRD